MERSYYRRPYAIKNQRGASKKPLVGGFGCEELVLYSIRDTITTPRRSLRHRDGPHCSLLWYLCSCLLSWLFAVDNMSWFILKSPATYPDSQACYQELATDSNYIASNWLCYFFYKWPKSSQLGRCNVNWWWNCTEWIRGWSFVFLASSLSWPQCQYDVSVS